ncbi:MAG: hypothetical protein HQL59_05345 [Magnetococcales bacterium]|nr:hypothetical protein [Magnetococcales bacterium]
MGISIRAYAKMKGVSDTAVHKAIRSGRIPAEPDGTIDPARADAAWVRNTSPALQRKTEPAPPPPVREALPSAPVRETPPLPQPRPTVRAPSPEPEPAAGNPAVPNYQVSRAIRETYNAKLTRMDYEERQGKLLKAEDVARDAFEMARRVRDRLLGIPSRMAAVLASETDAKTIERLLDQELRIALEELSR